MAKAVPFLVDFQTHLTASAIEVQKMNEPFQANDTVCSRLDGAAPPRSNLQKISFALCFHCLRGSDNAFAFYFRCLGSALPRHNQESCIPMLSLSKPAEASVKMSATQLRQP